MNKQERRTAIHEAGHAVAAYRLGLRLHKMSIAATEDALGWVRHSRALKGASWHANDIRTRLQLEREAQAAVAGARAVRRAYPGSRWRQGAEVDYRAVGDLLVHMFPILNTRDYRRDPGWRAQSAWWTIIEYEADCLLAANWHLVEALADALIERRTLNGAHATAVIQDAAARYVARKLGAKR